MKRGRPDANHAEIRDSLPNFGYHVVDYRDCGEALPGHPDLAAWKQFQCVLMEVKTEKGKLRKSQIKFIEGHAHRVPIIIVRSLRDALQKLYMIESDSAWRDPEVKAIQIAAAKGMTMTGSDEK